MSDTGELAIKVGDLLIRSGAVSAETLQDLVALADKMHMTLGGILEMNKIMSESVVKDAETLKDRVDAGELKLEQAVKAMEMVARQGVPLEAALRQITPGMSKQMGGASNHKVGEMMALSGIVDPMHVNKGLYNSLNTMLPLGMVLVQMDVATPNMLLATLASLRMVRDGVLRKDQAVQALRAARLRGTTLAQSLQDHGFPTTGLKQSFGLGELLVLASVLTETQLLAAREIELVEEKPLDTVLIECGMVSDMMLSASQQLLAMIGKGQIFEDQAASFVRKLKRARTREEMAEIMKNFQLEATEHSSIEIDQLLQLSGLITSEEIEAATPQALSRRSSLMQVLVEMGVLTPRTAESAFICKQYVDSGAIDPEQGVIALSYAAKTEDTFAHVLNRFGWNRLYAGAS